MNWFGEPRIVTSGRIGGGAGEPLILDEGVNLPLRIEEILQLAAGAVRIEAAAGVVDRQQRQPAIVERRLGPALMLK